MTFFDDVSEFHRKFGLPATPDSPPGLLEPDTQLFRLHFLLEELHEFQVAYAAGDLPEAADALVDLCYVAMGTATLMGLPFNELWNEVQRANWSKVRATDAGDERSKRKHSLDVVKPLGWKAPDHVPALRAAGWGDPHVLRAMELFGVSYGEVTPDQRRAAKLGLAK